MAAKTTSIELKGDRVQARSLAEAHVNRLLLDFRKNASFQSLPIYSQTKKFYDQTGAYVGTVYMQTVNGAENVVVSCWSGRKYVEEHLEMERSESVSMIVPCMRSTDNHWWVACLSGTFEGPYYAFENIGDAFTPEMMDDNAEADLDGQLLAIGMSPINNIPNPELYFIAQTGKRPDGNYEWIEATDADTPRWEELTRAEQLSYVHEVIGECCAANGDSAPGGPAMTACVSIAVSPFAYAKISHQSLNVFNQPSIVPNIVESETYNAVSEGFKICSFGLSSDCAFELITAYERYDAYVADTEGDPTSSYAGLFDATTIDYTRGVFSFGSVDNSTRVEEAYAINGAVCYRTRERTETTIQDITVSAECLADSTIVTTIDNTDLYCDYFKVDATVFPLRTASSNEYPKYQQAFYNQVKYYNTDSMARITGMMSAYILETSSTSDWFEYNYVGPNSQNDIASTRFEEFLYGGYHEHSVADAQNLPTDDEPVTFRGEIFLGEIRYSKTEKVKLY